MKCKNCGNEIVSAGNRIKVFCSDKCRMQYKRSNRTIQSEQIQSEQPIQSEQSNPNSSKRTAGYKLIPGDKVYGRPAVQYNIAEPWRLRPEPENESDKPILNNRGKYQRQDTSKYQIDSTGSIHNLTNNQVYQDIDDVKLAGVI